MPCSTIACPASQAMCLNLESPVSQDPMLDWPGDTLEQASSPRAELHTTHCDDTPAAAGNAVIGA